MLQFLRISTLLTLLLALPLALSAQLTASANFEQIINSKTTNFFFSAINGAEVSGSSIGATKCWWKRFDPQTNTFSIDIKEEFGSSSLLNNLTHNGGYQFSSTNGIDTTTYYCWTFEPKITLDTVYVDSILNTCSQIGLKAITKTVPCNYRNPSDLTDIETVDYKLNYSWTATPADVVIPSIWNPTFTQPIENTNYSVILTNGIGLGNLIGSTTKTHQAKGLRAILLMKSLSPDTLENTLDSLGLVASGPYSVGFRNNSKGNFDFAEITIYKDDSTVPYQSTPFEYDPNRPFTFTEQGKYRISIAISSYTTECTDISSDTTITIGGSVIGIPNAFTPDGDGVNDEFKIVYLSLREYNIFIYNRWGRLVYSSDNPTEGWDGGGLAVGVYFYAIEATGVDGAVYRQKGPIHLIRGKN